MIFSAAGVTLKGDAFDALALLVCPRGVDAESGGSAAVAEALDSCPLVGPNTDVVGNPKDGPPGAPKGNPLARCDASSPGSSSSSSSSIISGGSSGISDRAWDEKRLLLQEDAAADVAGAAGTADAGTGVDGVGNEVASSGAIGEVVGVDGKSW